MVHSGVATYKSDAALTVLSHLPGWGWVRVLRAVPKAWRDGGVQSRRKELVSDFGKYETCFVTGSNCFVQG